MSLYFNPRSPSGLRLELADITGIDMTISIHAARVGCDNDAKALITPENIFQSTQPEWAATDAERTTGTITSISIHAARVGCDIN